MLQNRLENKATLLAPGQLCGKLQAQNLKQYTVPLHQWKSSLDHVTMLGVVARVRLLPAFCALGFLLATECAWLT